MTQVETVKISEISDINPRLTSRPGESEQVSFVPMSAVDASTGAVTASEERPFHEVRKGYTFFQTGDLLLAKITPCFENGKIAEASVSCPVGVGSTEFHVLRPDLNRVNPRYLLHFLRQPLVRHLGERKMTGSGGQRRVPESFVSALEVPLPRLEEQQRIASILDHTEKLRSSRRDAIKMLENLGQAIFLSMFGDRRPSTESWPIRPFGDLVSNFRYGTSHKSGSQGKPTLRIPNVVRGELDLSELKLVSVSPSEFNRLKLSDGDLLFVRTNGNPEFVGRCATFERHTVEHAGFPTEEYIYASYLIRARLHNEYVIPVFVREFMTGAGGRTALRSRCKTSAGQYNLNIQGLGSVPIPVPPLDLQQEFANQIADLGALRQRYRANLSKLDELFESLQDRAFRGEL